MKCLIAVFLLGLPATAWPADADPFDPSGSLIYGRGTLQGESPLLGGGGFAGGLLGNVTEDLVVYSFADGSESPVLSTTLATTLQGAYTVEDLLRVDLFLPVYAYAEAHARPGGSWEDHSGASFGDVRVQGLFPFWNSGDDLLSVAGVVGLGLPTGQDKALLGRGVHGTVTAVVGGEHDIGLGYLANAGLTLAPSEEIDGVALGSTVDLLGGAYWRVDEGFRVGAEAEYSVGLAKGTRARNDLATAHLFVQSALSSGLSMTIGTGTGLLAGVGSPDYRLFAAISYGAMRPDKDRDGLTDDEDACPLEAEDIDSFEDLDGCPDPDNDGDGVPDLADGCADRAEDPDGFGDADGCPDPDNDGDGLLDGDDDCPDQSGAEELGGCPDRDGDAVADPDDECPDDRGSEDARGCPDSDNDRVPDYLDECPELPRPSAEDVTFSDGCPKAVYVAGDGIHTEDKLLFGSAVTTLSTSNRRVLDAVATLLGKATRVAKVEVGGHADGREGDSLGTSTKRAQVVVDYLVGKGIESSRLVVKGYGSASPVDTNRTSSGRAKNRRVEMRILDKNPWLVSEEAEEEPEATLEAAPEVEPEVAPVVPEAAPEAGGTEAAPIESASAVPEAGGTEAAPTEAAPEAGGTETAPEAAIDVGRSGPPEAGGVEAAPEAAPTEVASETAPEATLEGAASPAPEPPAAEQRTGIAGTLTVVLHGGSYASVYVDDRKLAVTAPFKGIKLAGGSHTIWVVNERFGIDQRQDVFVDGDEVVVEIGQGGSEGTGEPGAGPWELGATGEADTPWTDSPETPAPEEADGPIRDVQMPDDPWSVPWLDEEQGSEDSGKRRKKKKKKKKRKEPPPPPPPAEDASSPWEQPE